MSHSKEDKKIQVNHTPEEIHRFVNIEIRKWKAIKSNPNHALGNIAIHYISAFETMEMYLFSK